MYKKILSLTLLALIASVAVVSPFVSAESNTLLRSDFQKESFQKTVNYFEYARAYATLHGLETPDNFDQWHANMYMTYINTSGIQLLYSGLENITTDGSAYLRIPAQSILMHYKTNVENQDALVASTFLMLMAFNDSANSRIVDSPDVGDNLYASYSLGFDYSSIGAERPALNSKTEVIPLTNTPDKLQWSWGMRYTNLTALWWKTWINPDNAKFDNSLPFAITTYDELTFKYTLTIDPANGKAVLTENHDIGRMRDMVISNGLLWAHLNSTGTYGLLGRQKLSDQTIYGFLESNKIKMSIVDYQTTIIANHTTYSTTSDGQAATTDQLISDGAINTYTDSGNKISTLDFSVKPTYNLYNYTQDSTQTTYQSYNAVTRTADVTGFSRNTGLFQPQIRLMRFLPLVVVHMYPGLYQKASESISDMTKANYFYITSYPTYSGYRIEHDPVLTAYTAVAQASTATPTGNSQLSPNGLLVAIILVVIVAAVIVILSIVLFARRQKLPLPPPPP